MFIDPAKIRTSSSFGSENFYQGCETCALGTINISFLLSWIQGFVSRGSLNFCIQAKLVAF